MSQMITAGRQPNRPARPPGRPWPIIGKRWQGDVVGGVVHFALALRDLDDPKSVTEATTALWAGVETLLDRTLTGCETERLRRLAAKPRPSAIIPLLHRLNGGITNRVARKLAPRSNISELVWG